MTDYRLTTTTTTPMNLWTSDDNASVIESFMSSDLSTFWPPPPSQQPQLHHELSSAALTSTPTPAPIVSQSQPSVALFNQETLQQRLQALIEGARESWTYAIFWQSSYDYSSTASVLGWGDGYYKGEDDKSKSKAKNRASSSAAEQEHRKKVLRELNSLISGSATPASDDAIEEEVTDTEWFFLVSMTQSFVNGGGLPGQAFFQFQPDLGHRSRPLSELAVRSGSPGSGFRPPNYGLYTLCKWGCGIGIHGADFSELGSDE